MKEIDLFRFAAKNEVGRWRLDPNGQLLFYLNLQRLGRLADYKKREFNVKPDSK